MSSRPSNVIPVASKAHVNGIVYGEPGVGKSVLMGTAPRALILANNMDETVSMRGSDAQVRLIGDHDELSSAVDDLMFGDYKKYDNVILDNGTLFQEQGMDGIMEALVADKPHRDRWVPDMAQYLVNQNRFSFAVRTLCGLPVNFWMTAHVMSAEDEEDNTYFLPAFQGGRGQFSQKLCGYMNVVFYMKAIKRKGKPVERKLYTAKTSRILAKDRFGLLDPIMTDVTIPDIMAIVGGAVPARKTTTTTKRKRTSTTSREG